MQMFLKCVFLQKKTQPMAHKMHEQDFYFLFFLKGHEHTYLYTMAISRDAFYKSTSTWIS